MGRCLAECARDQDHQGCSGPQVYLEARGRLRSRAVGRRSAVRYGCDQDRWTATDWRARLGRRERIERMAPHWFVFERACSLRSRRRSLSLSISEPISVCGRRRREARHDRAVRGHGRKRQNVLSRTGARILADGNFGSHCARFCDGEINSVTSVERDGPYLKVCATAPVDRTRVDRIAVDDRLRIGRRSEERSPHQHANASNCTRTNHLCPPNRARYHPWGALERLRLRLLLLVALQPLALKPLS